MVDDLKEARFRDLLTNLPQIVFSCRGTGHWIWAGPQWVIYTGQPSEWSCAFGWIDAVHPDDRRLTLDAWGDAAASGDYLVEHRIRQASDGQYRWHQTRAAPLLHDGDNKRWAGSSADIDDLHRLQEQTGKNERQLRILVEGVPQLIWRSHDMGRWTWASPQWLSFTGQTQQQTHDRGWLDAVHPDDREAAMVAWEAAGPNGQLDVDFRVYRISDGEYLWHRTRSTPVRDDAGKVLEWLGTTTDIEDLKRLQQHQKDLLIQLQQQTHQLEDEVKEREQIEARLLYEAQHDGLTWLYNREFLVEQLRLALQQPERNRCAVLFLDLDRFKLVNDSLGHGAGNLLLIEVARRLKACVAAQATLARFGGDEFMVLIDAADDLDVATKMAAQIVEALRQPIWLGTQEIFPSCSIGVVKAADSHLLPEQILRDADIAMYHAKRNGSGRYAVFTEAMRDSAVEALELRTDLRNALSQGQLYLVYQPICNTMTRSIIGVEALLRWQHPRRGLVSPAIFIGIAEETAVIHEIGHWVMWEACAQMQIWRNQFPHLKLSLNVNTSAEELKHPAFTQGIRRALAATGLDPRVLQIEITESVFLQQPDLIGNILDGIRLLGVRIALDDFGTGYSSLSYLDRYQVDTIKIDRSIVSGMPMRPRTVAIVEAIVRLGQSVGLDVVAEGIEEEKQLQAVQSMGCNLVQGFLLGRPMTSRDLKLALEHQSDSERGSA